MYLMMTVIEKTLGFKMWYLDEVIGNREVLAQFLLLRKAQTSRLGEKDNGEHRLNSWKDENMPSSFSSSFPWTFLKSADEHLSFTTRIVILTSNLEAMHSIWLLLSSLANLPSSSWSPRNQNASSGSFQTFTPRVFVSIMPIIKNSMLAMIETSGSMIPGHKTWTYVPIMPSWSLGSRAWTEGW